MGCAHEGTGISIASFGELVRWQHTVPKNVNASPYWQKVSCSFEIKIPTKLWNFIFKKGLIYMYYCTVNKTQNKQTSWRPTICNISKFDQNCIYWMFYLFKWFWHQYDLKIPLKTVTYLAIYSSVKIPWKPSNRTEIKFYLCLCMLTK